MGAVQMAIVGGTACMFANGAMGSAFQYLFNDFVAGSSFRDADKVAFGSDEDDFHFFEDTASGRTMKGIGNTFYRIGVGLHKSLSSLETNIYATYKDDPVGRKMGQMLFIKSNANGNSALRVLEASDAYNGVGIIRNELK